MRFRSLNVFEPKRHYAIENTAYKRIRNDKYRIYEGRTYILTRMPSQVAVQNRRTRHQIRYTGDGFGKHTDGHVADQEGGLSRVRRSRRHQMQIPRRM